MPRKPDAAVAERNRAIISRLIAGETVPELAEEFGLSESHIYHLAKDAGVKVTLARSVTREKSTTQQRRTIGAKIQAVRMFALRMEPEPFSRTVGISCAKLGQLEKGHDFKMSELEKILDYCGLTLIDVMTKDVKALLSSVSISEPQKRTNHV